MAIDVEETLLTAADAPPTETVAPTWNAEPDRVTAVPPEVGPRAGSAEAIAGGGGGATNVNAAASVEAWPSGFVTTTLTVPAACAGGVAAMEVAATTQTSAL